MSIIPFTKPKVENLGAASETQTMFGFLGLGKHWGGGKIHGGRIHGRVCSELWACHVANRMGWSFVWLSFHFRVEKHQKSRLTAATGYLPVSLKRTWSGHGELDVTSQPNLLFASSCAVTVALLRPHLAIRKERCMQGSHRLSPGRVQGVPWLFFFFWVCDHNEVEDSF